MFAVFNSESLWIGTDLKRFNEIRDILDSQNIKYKYKVKDQLGEWLVAEHSGDVWEVQESSGASQAVRNTCRQENLEQARFAIQNDTVFFIRHQIFLNESGVFLCVKTCYLYSQSILNQNENTDIA